MLFIDILLLGLICHLAIPPILRRHRRAVTRLDREGLDAQHWLEHHLADGRPVPVTNTRWNTHGDRLRFGLADGTSIRLSCFWPRPVEITQLRHAFFRHDIGWVIDGEAGNGDRVRFFAWNVRLQHP